MLIDLTGKVVMITNGASGLGRILSSEFARSGADIVATCPPGQLDEAAGFAEEIEAAGRKALLLELSSDTLATAKTAIDRIEEVFGRLDAMILHPLEEPSVDFDKMTAEDWDTCDQRIAKYSAFLCREASRLMLKNQFGRIIALGDNSFYENRQDMVPYESAECSLTKLMMGLSVYYAPYIKCNAVNVRGLNGETGAEPGAIIEDRMYRWLTNDIYGVAELLQFLVGCRNSCGISGAMIPVDNAQGLMSSRNW